MCVCVCARVCVCSCVARAGGVVTVRASAEENPALFASVEVTTSDLSSLFKLDRWQLSGDKDSGLLVRRIPLSLAVGEASLFGCTDIHFLHRMVRWDPT